jgi:hypothetical protein
MMSAKKSAKRIKIITKLLSIFSNPTIFEVVNRHSWSEERIQTYMYTELLKGMSGIFKDMYPHYSSQIIEKKANRAIKWGGHKGKTIHNLNILGVIHRPDFEIEIDATRIAVEVKKGADGSSVREGIGQCLVFSVMYHFVIYVLVDATGGFSIRDSVNGKPEESLINGLWDHFNIRLQVV